MDDESMEKTSQTAKKIAKTGIKLIAKTLVKLLGPYLVTILLIIVILGSFVWFINGWDVQQGNGLKELIFGTTEISGHTSEIVNKALKYKKYSEKEIEKMSDEEKANILGLNEIDLNNSAKVLWKIDDVFSRYLRDSDQLEKLLNAEIITQYPYIDNLSKDKLNGIIKFYRQANDGQEMQRITYVDESTFNQYVENYRKATESNIESARKELLSHFTMSGGQTIKVATFKEITEEITSDNPEFTLKDAENARIDIFGESNTYTITKTDHGYIATGYTVSIEEVLYINMISKYTMPFDYLWTLAVIADDKGAFAEALAEYCYNSEIEITIYDNTDTNIIEETYSYKTVTKVDTKAIVGIKDSSDIKYRNEEWEDINTSENPITINYKKTTIDNTKTVALTKANTWISNSTLKYNKVGTPSEGEFEKIDVETDTEFVDIGSSEYSFNIETQKAKGNSSLLNNKYAQELLNKIKTSENSTEDSSDSKEIEITYVSEATQERKTEISQTTKKSSSSVYYDSGKVEKNGEYSEKFITALNNNSKAKGNILEVSSWLFEFLEENDETANMVTLTKALLNEVTSSTDYGDIQFDFSIYDISEFSSFAGVYGNTIQEKVWFALKELGYSDIAVAGAMGNIDYESGGFNPNAVEKKDDGTDGPGIGLIQWTSENRKNGLLAYAKSKGVDWTDVDTQIEYLVAEISGCGPASGFATQRTRGAIVEEMIFSTHDQWANSKTIDESTLAFMRFFESPKSNSSYKTRLEKAEKYYKAFSGGRRNLY